MSVHQSCTNVRIRPLLSYYLLNVPQIFQTINNHGRAKISALLRVQDMFQYLLSPFHAKAAFLLIWAPTLQIGQKFFKCRNQSHDRHLPANPTLDITDQSFGVLANNDLNWCGPSGLEENMCNHCRNETGFHKNIGDFFRTYMLRLEKNGSWTSMNGWEPSEKIQYDF